MARCSSATSPRPTRFPRNSSKTSCSPSSIAASHEPRAHGAISSRGADRISVGDVIRASTARSRWSPGVSQTRAACEECVTSRLRRPPRVPQPATNRTHLDGATLSAAATRRNRRARHAPRRTRWRDERSASSPPVVGAPAACRRRPLEGGPTLLTVDGGALGLSSVDFFEEPIMPLQPLIRIVV